MTALPDPLFLRTCSDGIRHAQLQDPELVELGEYGEFDGMLNDVLSAGENDCAEGTA